MKELNEFVARENKWAGIFGNTVEIKTAKGRKDVANRIDCALSPENLTCDGELPGSQVQARYKALTTAANQLKQLDPTVKMYEFA